MQVERPDCPDLTPEELQHLAKLREVAEQAIADGVLSLSEREQITRLMAADYKVTPQELEILRTVIMQRVETGEVVMQYPWPKS